MGSNGALNEKNVDMFCKWLALGERSTLTVSKYAHDARTFLSFVGDRDITRERVLEYKEYLLQKYAVTSANSMIAALNSFVKFCKRDDLCIKQFRTQRTAYCSENKELLRSEYTKLISCARERKNERAALLAETICSTGIRVGELKYITVEALKRGEASVNCKGKSRRVFITGKLCNKLLKYAKTQNIVSGSVFVTRKNTPISRYTVWRELKALSVCARVARTKVFPHNLRHLFARAFYEIDKDIVKLADILGHSSVDTTRIYVVSSGYEHRRRLENMHLVA